MAARLSLTTAVLAALALTATGCGPAASSSSTPTALPTITASPVPTQSPTQSPELAVCNKLVTRARPGRELISSAQSEFPMALALEVPAGWKGCGLFFNEAPGGLMMVGMWKVGFVYPDPCHWKQTLATRPATGSAAEIAQGFADQDGTDATPVEQSSIDGYSAWHLRISVRSDMDGTQCEPDTGVPEFRFMQGDGDSVWWLDARDAPTLVADVWALDVDGAAFVIQTVRWSENSAALVAEQAAMVESIDFNP